MTQEEEKTKSVAVSFAEWLDKESWFKAINPTKGWTDGTRYLSISELYDKFHNQKNK